LFIYEIIGEEGLSPSFLLLSLLPFLAFLNQKNNTTTTPQQQQKTKKKIIIKFKEVERRKKKEKKGGKSVRNRKVRVYGEDAALEDKIIIKTLLDKVETFSHSIYKLDSHFHFLEVLFTPMARQVLVVASACFATFASASHPWPAFAKDFLTEVVQTEAQNQGYYYVDDVGDTCCPSSLLNETYACKLQMQYTRGQYFEQGSKNRSRSDNVIAWYDDVMKAIALEPAAAGSKYKWKCVAYCPIDDLDTFQSLVSIGDCGPEPESCPGKYSPRNEGKVHISQARPFNNVTKVVDNWAWTKLLAILPVEENSMYVDNSDPSYPVPFKYVSKLAPAGQVEGIANLSYVGWKPANYEHNTAFDVDPSSIQGCPVNPGGCGGSGRDRRRLLMKTLKAPFVQSRKNAGVANLLSFSQGTVAPSIPFPDDWSGFIEYENVENAGAEVKRNGDICCPYNSPNCLVVYTQLSEYHYYDYTNQRLRVEVVGVEDDVQVDDFRTMKSMKVFNVSGVETCVEYCPIEKGATLRKYFPFPKDDVVHDMGMTKWKGKSAHKYKWADTLFPHSIPMITHTLFVDESSERAGTAKPLEEYTDITPFNETKLERQRKTWKTFNPGSIPASKFNIHGMSKCPLAKDCNKPPLLPQHRRRFLYAKK
jgi:hypothetical protein